MSKEYFTWRRRNALLRQSDPDFRQGFLDAFDELLEEIGAHKYGYRVRAETFLESEDQIFKHQGIASGLARSRRKWHRDAHNPNSHAVMSMVRQVTPPEQQVKALDRAKSLVDDFRYNLGLVRAFQPTNYLTVPQRRRTGLFERMLADCGITIRDIADLTCARRFIDDTILSLTSEQLWTEAIFDGFLIGSQLLERRKHDSARFDYWSVMAACAFHAAGWAAQRMGNRVWTDMSVSRLEKLQRECTDASIVIFLNLMRAYQNHLFHPDRLEKVSPYSRRASMVAEHNVGGVLGREAVGQETVRGNPADECCILGGDLDSRVNGFDKTVRYLFRQAVDDPAPKNVTDATSIRLKFALRLAEADELRDANDMLSEAAALIDEHRLADLRWNQRLVEGMLAKRTAPTRAEEMFEQSIDLLLKAGDLTRPRIVRQKMK
jgi:hypothetical protein